ncbi:dienelactone hydrolase family protein [Hyphobacterium sp. SN044]|uniref:dienelactone hydrolase family protein n=1 Tax=Hyphobacterium sp. SN044 TaxID=2912575 RepID=UPI001F185D74|nr:dienelactone hydrolase family protein [Hyphobacterium sp. SN044]MCF8880444.1 dienelactone hydrolase family protein [Hyphobacterium sp. SN044]
MGHMIEIESPDGKFAAYRADPMHAARRPAVIVLQEIFGVNAVMRGVCDDLAAKGFLAICPDLFWRIEPGVDITDKSDAEWKKAFDLMNRFDPDTGIIDIQRTIDQVRRDRICNGHVGAVGYCLGGLLAYLTACRTDCEASVGYYGVNIAKYADEAKTIKGQLMLHIAGKDQFVDAEAQKAMHAALDPLPNVTLHDYPERDHAFARIGGDHYDEADAATANARTLQFLSAHLQG